MNSINDIFNKRYNGKSVFFSSYKNSLKKVVETIIELNNWEKTYFIYSNAFDSLTNESIEELKVDLLQTTFLSVDLLFEKEVRQIFNKYKNGGIIFYFETYSYRTKHIFRFEFLKTLKKHFPNLQIIVNNTSVTSAIFNPFFFPEVDIVLNNLGKFGENIYGNVIITNNTLYEKLKEYNVDCNFMIDKIKKINNNVKKLGITTMYAIDKMRENNIEVHHPYLESDSSNFLALKYFKGQLPPHLLIKYSYNDETSKKSFISYFGFNEEIFENDGKNYYFTIGRKKLLTKLLLHVLKQNREPKVP